MCSAKEMFFKMLQNLQKKRVPESVFNKVKLAALFRKDSDTDVFL